MQPRSTHASFVLLAKRSLQNTRHAVIVQQGSFKSPARWPLLSVSFVPLARNSERKRCHVTTAPKERIRKRMVEHRSSASFVPLDLHLLQRRQRAQSVWTDNIKHKTHWLLLPAIRAQLVSTLPVLLSRVGLALQVSIKIKSQRRTAARVVLVDSTLKMRRRLLARTVIKEDFKHCLWRMTTRAKSVRLGGTELPQVFSFALDVQLGET